MILSYFNQIVKSHGVPKYWSLGPALWLTLLRSVLRRKALGAQGGCHQLRLNTSPESHKPTAKIMATDSAARLHVASHHHGNEMHFSLTSP